MKNYFAAATIALFVGLAAVGCGSAASTPTSGSTGQPPAINDDPNDPYNAFLSSELLSINSAMMELDYKCYADNGYPEFLQVLPTQKANEFRSMAQTPDFKATFASFSELPWFPSEEYARAAGYGHRLAAGDASVFTKDPSFGQVSKDCRSETMKKISGSDYLVTAYSKLGNTLAEALTVAARQNKDSMSNKVFECMSRNSHPVDAKGPNKAPGWGVDFGVPLGAQPRPMAPDLTKGGTTQVVPAKPEQPYVPTAQESDSAAAMYRCSVDTGTHDDWLKAMRDAKGAALAKNEASLTELNPQIKELAKSAALAVQSKS